jgi:hypothetical protein
MTIFRWVIGIVAGLMALGALASFLLFLGFDIRLWLERARRFRHWTWLASPFWFNAEVWGRVASTLVTR